MRSDLALVLASGGSGVDDNLPVNWNIEAPAVIKAKKACANLGIAIPAAGVAWLVSHGLTHSHSSDQTARPSPT